MSTSTPSDGTTEERHTPTGTAEELAALGRVMGELVHDLSNEVTVLHGWALLAKGEAEAGGVPTAELERVLEVSGALGGMLRDVLDTVAGRAMSPEEAFDPRALTEETVARRVRAMSDREVRLRMEVPAGVRVAGRASFWARVLSNLLVNAERHSRREVRVWLGIESGGTDRVVLRVEDDGPGVEPGERGSIFEPFWRGSRGGSGLGLSSALWAVRQLGGEIGYRSGVELGGAAFEARVPVARSLAGRVRSSARPRPTLAGLTVVLVDDDAAVRAALVPLLRRGGVEARAMDPAATGADTLLEELRSAPPDVLVLDLRMGQGDGVSLWRRIGAELPELARRVVFVSGAAPGEPDWEEAEATGQPLLAKPFDVGDLAAAAARLPRG